jgi:hypothetical protein
MVFPGAHPPDLIMSVVTSQKLASEYAARWFPAFLSLFGALIALQRRDQLDLIALAWTAAMIFIVILADCGLLKSVGTADRLMLVLYLPLSLLAATSLSRMDAGDKRTIASFLLALLLTGIVGMGAVFYSYANSWGLPQQDYDAITWLSEQNLSDPFCVNLDETGLWIYPLAGISVSNPGYGSETYYSFSHVAPRIVVDANDDWVLKEMRRIGHEDILVYVSDVSISRPGYVAPFTYNASMYPEVNLSFSLDKYELLYDHGARIFRIKKDEVNREK